MKRVTNTGALSMGATNISISFSLFTNMRQNERCKRDVCKPFHQQLNKSSYQKNGVGEIRKDFVALTHDQELGDDAFVRLVGDFRVNGVQIGAVGSEGAAETLVADVRKDVYEEKRGDKYR